MRAGLGYPRAVLVGRRYRSNGVTVVPQLSDQAPAEIVDAPSGVGDDDNFTGLFVQAAGTASMRPQPPR